MATPKVSPQLKTIEEIREILRQSTPDTQCQQCHRITSRGGEWCPYCGGQVKHLGKRSPLVQ
jgi:rRNA maturation endonuclease Nob1